MVSILPASTFFLPFSSLGHCNQPLASTTLVVGGNDLHMAKYCQLSRLHHHHHSPRTPPSLDILQTHILSPLLGLLLFQHLNAEMPHAWLSRRTCFLSLLASYQIPFHSMSGDSQMCIYSLDLSLNSSLQLTYHCLVAI